MRHLRVRDPKEKIHRPLTFYTDIYIYSYFFKKKKKGKDFV